MEKTEEQIAKDKAAVVAMRGACDAMATTLERNALLERALERAITNLKGAKEYIAARSYAWTASGRDQQTVHAIIDAQVAELMKAL